MQFLFGRPSEIIPTHAGTICAVSHVGAAMACAKFLDRDLSASMDGLEVSDERFESISRYVDSLIYDPGFLLAVASIPADAANDESDPVQVWIIG